MSTIDGNSSPPAPSRERSDAWFRALMEQSPLSTQVFSADGRTVKVNRAWEQLWGVTIEHVADYNVLARSFPTNLTAMMFNYDVKPSFTVENEKSISNAPTVNFGK